MAAKEYVAREDVERARQDVLYEPIEAQLAQAAKADAAETMQAKSDQDVAEAVQRLADLSHHYVSNTQIASAVIISNAKGYCSFINGVYRRVRDTTFDERPVFRLDKAVPHNNSSVSGNFLFLYFKEKQKSWAIGLKLGSSGVLAYRKTQGLDPITGSAPWFISDAQCKFSPDPDITIEAAGGYMVQPADEDQPELDRPQNMLPPGTSRREAEKLLLSHITSGTFVVRESTSVANTFIISALTRHRAIEHLQVEVQPSSCRVVGTSVHAATFDSLVHQLQVEGAVQLATGEVFPALSKQVTAPDEGSGTR